MRDLIITKLPTTTADAIKTAMQAQIVSMTPFKINLSDGEKIGGRTMAEGREGLARLVSKIASANIESLAREHNPQDLEDRLAYDAKMEELRQLGNKFLELVTETQLANSIDCMTYVDAYSDNLQTSRRNNGTLDLAMREVDEWNKRFAHKTDTPPAV
jgi:hypothetical protein